jgi:hypothetical protein
MVSSKFLEKAFAKPVKRYSSRPAELSRKMGFLPYSNIPDFTGGHDPLKTIHRSLGFYGYR